MYKNYDKTAEQLGLLFDMNFMVIVGSLYEPHTQMAVTCIK